MKSLMKCLVLFLIPLFVLSVFLVGCPKKPQPVKEEAPAPVAKPAPVPAPKPEPAPPAVVPVTPEKVAEAPIAIEVPKKEEPPEVKPAPAPVPVAAAPKKVEEPPLRQYVETAALKDIHFDFDKSDIRPADANILEENAKWLKANAKVKLLIEGHCDERGTVEYNLALGERRAKSTRDYLVSLGIEPGRISMISYGKERPLDSRSNEEAWAKNRRGHFLIMQP